MKLTVVSPAKPDVVKMGDMRPGQAGRLVNDDRGCTVICFHNSKYSYTFGAVFDNGVYTSWQGPAYDGRKPDLLVKLFPVGTTLTFEVEPSDA